MKKLQREAIHLRIARGILYKIRGLRTSYFKYGRQIIRRGMVNFIQILKNQMLFVRKIVSVLPNEDLKKMSLKAEDINTMPRKRFWEIAEKLLAGKLALNNVFKDEMEYSICHIIIENGVCTYRRELELDSEWYSWKIEIGKSI